MEHISFDLETLSRSPKAAIVQIGAVKFNLEKGIYDEFNEKIDFEKFDNMYQNLDFDVNFSTLMWWFQQKNEVINEAGGYLRWTEYL